MIFGLLHEGVLKAAEVNIKQQAERAIGRRLMFLIEKYYPNFFAANDGHKILGQMTILGGITLHLHLKPAPQHMPVADYCTDLSQTAMTINEAGRLLNRLHYLAGLVELRG